MAHHRLYYVLLSWLFFSAVTSTTSANRVTITADAAFIDLRPCAQQCLWHGGAFDDLMGFALNCNSPWPDSCLCEPKNQSIALSFISSCASSRCSIGDPKTDVYSAANAYERYCVQHSYSLTSITTDILLKPIYTSLISIQSDNGYSSLSECAQECVWHQGVQDDVVARGVQCGVPWLNDCLCRPDLGPWARSFISSCASSRCSTDSPEQQLTSAVLEYDKYCAEAGYVLQKGNDVDGGAQITANGGASETGGSGGGGGGGGSDGTASTAAGPGSQPSQTGGSSGGSSGDGNTSHGLSTGALVGIAIGATILVIGVIALVGCIFFRRHKKDKKRRKAEELLRQQQASQTYYAYNQERTNENKSPYSQTGSGVQVTEVHGTVPQYEMDGYRAHEMAG